jgi:hypothetical protein
MPFQRALALLLCFMIVAGPARAQQIVPQGAIDQALTEKAADTAGKRQAIKSALAQPEVQRIAKSLGLDIVRAEASVGTLDGADLDRIAAQAQLVNEEVAGGQTVRLNLLWIIIGLLVLLIILVAVD